MSYRIKSCLTNKLNVGRNLQEIDLIKQLINNLFNFQLYKLQILIACLQSFQLDLSKNINFKNMQSSLRQLKIKTKIAKMKKSIDAFFQEQACHLNTSFKILKKQNLKTENSTTNQVSSIKQTCPENLSSFTFELLSSMKTNDSKQFSDENLYQPLSLSHKKKCRTKLRTLSYKNQRQKSVLKTEVAIKNIQKLDQFKINRFKNVNNTLRFNEEIEFAGQVLAFQPYKTIQQLKRVKLRSPSKGKSIIGKKAKTSPTKIRMNYSLYPKKGVKNMFRIKQFSNSQLLCAPPLLPKNSSISAWEVPQETY